MAGATPLLLWPALLDGHPYLFWDTYGYFTQGRDYWTVILALLGQGPVPPEAATGWIGAAGRILAREAAIRSTTYSLLFWPAAVLGSFWPTVVLQAAAAAYVVDVALDRLFGLALGRRLLTLAILAALSQLPWFAGYLMPDLFGGLMILALATLAFAHDRLAAGQRLALSGLTLLAVSFHSANLPLALALVPTGAALSPAGQRLGTAARLGLPVAGAVALLAALGWLAFGKPTLTPASPPFLLARQIEDGPTIPYLREACGRGEGWALCPHLDRIPARAEDFLWSGDAVSYWSLRAERERLRREEPGLVLRAALARPLLQLRASTANLLRQLASVGLGDLHSGRGAIVARHDYWFGPGVSPVPLVKHDLGRFSALLQSSTALGLAVVLSLARTSRGLPRAGWFLLLGVVANAAVCGILSGPHHRYQARVAWLVPLVAAALVAGRPAAPTLIRPPPARVDS